MARPGPARPNFFFTLKILFGPTGPVSGGSRNFERGGGGGGGSNSLINYYFFLKVYQYIEIKYEQLY